MATSDLVAWKQYIQHSTMSDIANKPSTLLTTLENDLVFKLLGNECQSMCTAVAKVYTTSVPAHATWLYRHIGAVCVVRDCVRHSYFLRMYCLRRSELVWEEEVYTNFTISRTKKWLLIFEGRLNMVALDFCEPLEAKRFFKTTNMAISRIDRRHQKLIMSKSPTNGSSVGRRKITKSMIGKPSNFKHVDHWGFEADGTFTKQQGSVVNEILEKAGVPKSQMNNRETRQFIIEFIKDSDVLRETQKKDDGRDSSGKLTESVPPPPPPPPLLPALPVVVDEGHNISTNAPRSRNALLDGIKGGIQLKTVVPDAHSSKSNELLAQIRQGQNLRPAKNRDLSKPQAGGSAANCSEINSLADSLKIAMLGRQRAFHISSSEDECSDNMSDDDWDS